MMERTVGRRMRGLGLCFLLLVPGGWGCGEAAPEAATEVDEELRAELQGVLEVYLPVLSEAYATGNLEPLRAHAVERVMAQVEKRVTDLRAEGMTLEAELQGLVVENVNAWGNNFALVTTLETWDLRYYSTGAHTLFSERLATRNRVEYQMKMLDDRWTVFHRELKQEFDEP